MRFLGFCTYAIKQIIACGSTHIMQWWKIKPEISDSESSTCFYLIINSRHKNHALLKENSTRKSRGVVISLCLAEMIQINPDDRTGSLGLYLSSLPSKHCWNVNQHFQNSHLTSACLPARSKFETGHCHQCRCSVWLVQMTCTQRHWACRWARNRQHVRCEQDKEGLPATGFA